MALTDLRDERIRIPVSEWIDLLDREYLSDYTRSGGSVVKVVSGSDETLTGVTDSLCASALRQGYRFAVLDPAKLSPDGKKPDLHRIERFFFEVTGDVDWKGLAGTGARSYVESRGIRIGPGRALNDIDGIAADNGRDPSDLLHQYQREFATPLIRDHKLAIEFRSALAALSLAQLVPDTMTPTTEEVLLNWFAGRTMPGASAALKRIHIFGRIDRSSGRYMLASFCRWLPRTGQPGLVAVLDFRPYEMKRKSVTQRLYEVMDHIRAAVARGASQGELQAILRDDDAEPPISYSQAAYDQMLQMLRRFIDEIDWFEQFCLVVLVSPEYCQTEKSPSQDRHYTDYDALQTRIGLEVHDAKRSNPAAALVHLEESR